MTPEFKAYQEQVLRNCSKFAQVYCTGTDSYFCRFLLLAICTLLHSFLSFFFFFPEIVLD